MLLTIDIGTSTFKSALWDYKGKRLSFVSEPLSVDAHNGKYEANPSQWLSAFERCCKQLGKLDQVDAIVISGNGPTLVPVTGDNLPIPDSLLPAPYSNARLWLDRRAEKYQREVSEVMGGFVDACFFLPKILFIRNDENELYEKTKFFLGCPEYLAYALTGEARNVFPSAGFDRWFWNDSVLEKLNLDNSKFPVFIRPGDMFGFITSQTADRFGFRKKTPVISGGPDFFAAILGAGVTYPGQVCDRGGSSEGINLCTHRDIFDETKKHNESAQTQMRSFLMSYAHPVKPYWNLSGVINTSGKAIDWACGLLGVNSFDDFISLAKKSEAGSGGLVFIPDLAGERVSGKVSDGFSKNQCVSDSNGNASWSGISLLTGRSEAANSVLEGIGYAIKNVLHVMEDSGAKAAQLRVTGGLAGCSCLNQIKADITGLEVLEGVYSEAELLGLAIIGSCVMGKFSSCAEASKELCKVKKRYEPNPKNAELYNRLFYIYKKNIFHRE